MKTILLSRTDKIGDVILTLPMAGMIKKHFSGYRILFLVRGYTKAVAKRCAHIQRVYDWDKVKTGEERLPHIDYFFHVFPDPEVAFFAKKLKIKNRIGTSHRYYHWWTCNRLVLFSRKRSNLHESQLNMKLLRPLGINEIPEVSEMHQLAAWKRDPVSGYPALASDKINLIFHMKSLGSAREWPLVNYLELAKKLATERFQIYITGTAGEGDLIKKEIPEISMLPNVTDVTGRFDLSRFISFIEQCDGLLACSTGPLHIASIAGLKTLGLYASQKPIHAGRWAPIGKHCQILSDEVRHKRSFLEIDVDDVKQIIFSWVNP